MWSLGPVRLFFGGILLRFVFLVVWIVNLIVVVSMVTVVVVNGDSVNAVPVAAIPFLPLSTTLPAHTTHLFTADDALPTPTPVYRRLCSAPLHYAGIVTYIQLPPDDLMGNTVP